MNVNPQTSNSVVLNATAIGCTTNDTFATPLHRVPVVTPGRYSPVGYPGLVEVVDVSPAGVVYYELVNNEEDSSVLERAPNSKLMNTHVFALSHQPV